MEGNRKYSLIALLTLAMCLIIMCFAAFLQGNVTEISPDDTIYFADRKSSFRIVYPEGDENGASDIAQSVCDAIREATGGNPEIVSDAYEIGDEGSGEILIGLTNRPESSGCPDTLGQDDVFAGVINGQIVLLGGNSASLAEAARYFTENYVEGRKKCTVPSNLSYFYYAEEKMYKIPENIDRIKIVGRYSFVGEGIACDLSGSGIEFTADCEGDVKIQVEAPSADVFYVIYIDGVRQDERAWIKKGSTKIVTIASGLERGIHYFRFLKDSESRQPATLNRIYFTGAFCERPADKEILLEFIGDSITCGYDLGEEIQVTDSETAHFGATKAYAFICAETLDADYSIVAISGYAITGKGSIPDLLYPYTSWKRKPKPEYDFARVPSAVIVNLGTNESGSSDRAVSREEFEKGVRSFIKTVRADYKTERLPIIFVYDMMRDGYQDTIKKVVKEYGGEYAGLYTYKGVRSNARMNNHPGFDANRETGEGLA